MSIINDFFRDKSFSQRLMLGAVALNTLSQFFLYSDGSTSYVLHTDYFGYQWLVPPEGFGRATGWDLHLHAYPILVVLLICFGRDDVPAIPVVSRWGWWLAMVLLLWACFPTALDAWGFGTMWGSVSVIIAAIAAFKHWRERAKIKRAAP